MYYGTNINIDDLINDSNILLNLNSFQIYAPSYNKYIKYFDIIKKTIKKYNLQGIIHSSYTINLSNDWNDYSYWIINLIDDIKFAHECKIKYVVVHCGKAKDKTKEEAYNNMFSSLLYVLTKTIKLNPILLIETSSGQGSELCYKLEDLGYFYNKFKKLKIKNKIKICIDSCHIFSAGYDITSKTKIKEFFNKFNKLIGFEHICLIHLNDSKTKLNSRKDRHENIGYGYIGAKNLLYFVKYVNKYINKKIPFILETPVKLHSQDLQLFKF